MTQPLYSTTGVKHRYTRAYPCPICGHGHDDPAGDGVRCYGYQLDDQYARCTREGLAKGIPQNNDDTFSHWLAGPCRCGVEHREVVPALGVVGADGEIKPRRVRRSTPPPFPGLDVERLAAAKLLPPEALTHPFGVYNGESPKGVDAVMAPYWGIKRELVLTRYRTSLDSKFMCKKGDHLIPYGLWLLPEIEEDEDLLFVEGETDTWCAWHHGQAANGLPGGGTWRARDWAKWYEGRQRIYAWQEPGPVGKRMIEKLALSFPNLLVIKPPEGIKDVCDLHRILGGNTAAALEMFKAAAVPVNSWSLPMILLTDAEMRDVCAESLKALDAQNTPPRLFVRNSGLCRIARDEKEAPYIRPLDAPALRGELARAADYRTMDREEMLHPTTPPVWAVNDILAQDEYEGDFRPLSALIEAPALRPDGTVIQAAGYDPATRLYLTDTAALGRIPDEPSDEEVAEALAAIELVLAGFHWGGEDRKAQETSHANALALYLTSVLRPAITGAVPLAAVDAPVAGSGKGKLVRCAALIATGRTPESTPFTAESDEQEMRKTIFSLLEKGATFVTWDNVQGVFHSASLESALTEPDWSARKLGGSLHMKWDVRCTWAATGNNLRLGGDMPRRCYRINIDPQVARPWLLTEFPIPGELEDYVRDHRVELLRALLTMARSWFAAGCPEATTPILGSYGEWSRIVGGVLQHVGVRGFLGNLGTMYDELDAQGAEWCSFLLAWDDCAALGDWRSAGVIADQLAYSPELLDALPGELEQVYSTDENRRKGFRTKMGMALSKWSGRRFDEEGIRIEKLVDKHLKKPLFRIARD